MKTKKIYQLKEIYSVNGNTWPNARLCFNAFIDVLNEKLNLSALEQSAFYPSCPWVNVENNQYTLKDNAKEIIRAVLARYWDRCCVSTYSDDELDEEVEKFYNNFINILEMHWDYYDTLLSYYSTEKTNLLRQVQSSTSISSTGSGSDSTTASGSRTTSGTTGGTDTLTLNTKEETDGTLKKTGTDTSAVVYNSQVDTDRTTDTDTNTENYLQDTPQSDITLTDSYTSSTTHTINSVDDVVDETIAKSGDDTTTLTHNTTDTTDSEIKRTGTETTQHSGTTSGTETDSSTTSTTHSSTLSDTHTTNDDRDTLMARLNEIQNEYKKILLEVSNKFSELFWSVMNYEE